eukprot:6789439-Pyramimonas_sp.AAC.1
MAVLRAAWPISIDKGFVEHGGQYLHSSTKGVLSKCSRLEGDFDPSFFETLLIYTDGSGGSTYGHLPGPPAWAFV